MKVETKIDGNTFNTPFFEEHKDIFQFGKNKNLKRVLIDNTLGFSKLKDFNDPFEMSYSYFHHVENQILALQHLLNKSKVVENNLVSKVQRIIDEELESVSVCCFSKSPLEPLMWSHYSDKHSGICYCFDKSKLFPGLTLKSKSVIYSNTLAEINFYEKNTSLEILRHKIESIINTKSKSWSYENEYRFWNKTKEKSVRFNPKSLNAIIVGFRNLNKEEIIKLVEDFNKKNKMDVKIIYTRPSPQFYKMIMGYKDGIKSSSITIPTYNLNDKPISL